MNTLTRERLEQIYAECEERDPAITEIRAMVAELQERRKTSDPIYQVQYGNDWRDVDRGQYDDHAAHGSPVRIVYTAPPAPVSVPVALNRLRSIVADPRALPRRKEWISGQQYSYVLLENVEAMVDDACRAALLQGSQPVSNRDELSLDYLQGHKDGLEWAAQMAEANHPQTGDWLYDDPVELAKAIRKGPDMPEADGNSPVIPDGWIKCSNRMPDKAQKIIYTANGDVNCEWVNRRVTVKDEPLGWAVITYGGEGLFLGKDITHWMPLPAAPQQEAE